MRKVVLFAYLFIIGLIPYSCCLAPGHCGCGIGDTITSSQISKMVVFSVDSIGNQVDADQLIPYNNHFKRVQIDSLLYISSIFSEKKGAGNLYACSPAPIEIENPVDEIVIVATSEFYLNDPNSIIAVGTNISSNFGVKHFGDNYNNINHFIDSTYWSNETTHSFDLYLKQKPFEQTHLSFDMTITLTDGTLFEFKGEEMMVD